MTKFIGKKANVGIAKETTRGTAESAANYWLPKTSLSIDDQVDQVEDGNSVGVIEDFADVEKILEYAEGDIEGAIEIDSFGEMLLGTLGTVSTAADSPEVGVNTHTFTTAQNATHQALTLFIDDPNQQYTHANGIIDSMSIEMVEDDYAMYTASFQAKSGSTTTGLSASYTDTTRFRPQHSQLEIADDIASLDDTGYTDIQSMTLDIEKNVEQDNVLGQDSPRDFLNTQFSVTGSLEIIFNDETFKTEMLNDTYKAFRMKFVNDGVTIGSSANPEMQIDLDRVKITDFTRNYENDSIVNASVEFTATYDLSNSSMISVDLINTVTSY